MQAESVLKGDSLLVLSLQNNHSHYGQLLWGMQRLRQPNAATCTARLLYAEQFGVRKKMETTSKYLAWLDSAIPVCEGLQTADKVNDSAVAEQFASCIATWPEEPLLKIGDLIANDEYVLSKTNEDVAIAVLRIIRDEVSYMVGHHPDGTSITTIFHVAKEIEVTFTAKCEAYAILGAVLCLHIQCLDTEASLRLQSA